MNLYSRLADRRERPVGKWSGNQRWLAHEHHERLLKYTFLTYPLNESTGEADENGLRHGRRTLFRLSHAGLHSLIGYTYLPDGIDAETDAFRFRQRFPWGSYGSFMEWEFSDSVQSQDIQIDYAQSLGVIRETAALEILSATPNDVLVKDEPYFIAFHCEGHNGIQMTENGFTILMGSKMGKVKLTAAFHIEKGKAIAESRQLLADPEEGMKASARFWDAYLQSCPMLEWSSDYEYEDTYTKERVILTKETIEIRQLWHWWAALINVCDVEFNNYAPCMTPDRPNWLGTWSNDGPESICALAMTNQSTMARNCLVQYVKHSMDREGNLAWYTHSYGIGCFHHEHDSGYYSHGVPNFLHAVDFYIRYTGDYSLLDEDAGDGMTVWDKLKQYVYQVFQARDVNDDGLIEWANLWENGRDDRISPFFSSAPIEEWIETITRNHPEEVKRFYQTSNFPVTTVVEQGYFLWALESMRKIAIFKEETALAHYCLERFERMKRIIEQRHWDEKQCFYLDWDVRGDALSDKMNLDAYYYLYFTDDSTRVTAMMEHFSDPKHFGLRYLPTLSQARQNLTRRDTGREAVGPAR